MKKRQKKERDVFFCYDDNMEDLRSLLLFHLASAFHQDDKTPQGFDFVLGATRHSLSYTHLNWRLQRFSVHSIRSAISLMQREGCLISIQQGGKTWVRMTAAGRDLLFTSAPLLGRRHRWDGAWRVVLFSGVRRSIDSAQAYRSLRSLLLQHDFVAIERGVYLSPFPPSPEFMTTLQSLRAMGMLTMIETRKFLIGDDQDFARKAWDLDNISKSYAKLSKVMQGLLQELTTKKGLHDGQKAQYARYADQFFSLVCKDPALPSQVVGKDGAYKECLEVFAQLSSSIVRFES